MLELTNGLVENIACTNKTQKILLLIMYVYSLKITTFLWVILMLHPGRSRLFLETVTIKFERGEPRGKESRAGIWGQGQRTEKNKYPLLGSTFCDSLL